MGDVIGVARFTLHPERVEEFKRLAAECVDIARTRDTGTLGYDVFLDEQQTSAVIVERYRDADAMDEHAANIGEELTNAVLATTTSGVGEALGDLGAERRRAMADGPVRPLAPFLSLSDPA